MIKSQPQQSLTKGPERLSVGWIHCDRPCRRRIKLVARMIGNSADVPGTVWGYEQQPKHSDDAVTNDLIYLIQQRRYDVGGWPQSRPRIEGRDRGLGYIVLSVLVSLRPDSWQCNTSTSATSVCLRVYLVPSEVYQLWRHSAPAGRDVMQDDPNQIHPIPTSLPT